MLLGIGVVATLCLTATAWPTFSHFSPQSTSDIIHSSIPLYGSAPAGEENLLLPRHHPEHDASDHIHLCPEMTKSLFWGQETSSQYILPQDRYIHSLTTFQAPAVVLDHSSHITYTSVAEELTTVFFGSEDAFDTAASRWAEVDLPFILVTTADSDDGHFRYLSVSSFECARNLTTCEMSTIETHFDDAIDGFEITFGNYHHLMSKHHDKRAEAAWSSGQSDKSLDDALGYYNFDEGSFTASMDEFVEGLENPKYSDFQDTNLDDGGLFDPEGYLDVDYPVVEPDPSIFARKRGLKNRSFIDKINPFPKVIQAVKEGTDKIAQVTKDATGAVKETIDGFVDKVLGDYRSFKQWVDGTPKKLPIHGTVEIPHAGLHKGDRDSPFKDEKGQFYNALLLWDASKEKAIKSNSKKPAKVPVKFEGQLKLYCLSCGMTMKYNIAGHIAYKLGTGLTKASLSFDGSFKAAVRLGLAGSASLSTEYETRFAEVPLSPFQVPGFITLGPMVTFDLKGKLEANLKGNIMLGGTHEVVFNHEFSFLGEKAPRTKPKVTSQRFFEASTELSLSATASLPISLAFGLSVANGKFRATGKIVSEPALQIEASFGISGKGDNTHTNGDITSNSSVEYGTDGCLGVRLTTKAIHQLYAQADAKVILVDTNTKAFRIADDFEHKFNTTCIGREKKDKREESTNSIPREEGGMMFLTEIAEPLDPAPGDIVIDTSFQGENSFDVDYPDSIAAFLDEASAAKFSSSNNIDPKNPNTTGFNYTIISTPSDGLNLVATPEGNFGLTAGGDILGGPQLFAEFNNYIVGDAYGRVMVYFSQEMTTYNVSRIRLESSGKIPKTSRMIALTPVPAGVVIPNHPSSVLLPIDSVGRVYIPVICSYTNDEPSKMFIVSHLEQGIKSLKDSNTDKAITSGPISECQYLALTSGEQPVL